MTRAFESFCSRIEGNDELGNAAAKHVYCFSREIGTNMRKHGDDFTRHPEIV